MSVASLVRLASLLSLVPLASGHGLLVYPPMRGGTSGNGLNSFCPQCGNGAGVCGDGGQWGSSSDMLGHMSGPWTALTAGEVVEFVVEVTAHHRGHFEFGICDQEVGHSTEDAQGCFNARKLKRAPPPSDCVPDDERGDCQPVHEEYPERWYLPPRAGTQKMRFQIPSDLRCVSCTLQWRWWTSNSCVPARDYGCYFDRMNSLGWSARDWCGSFCGTCGGDAAEAPGCGEEFRNCADIEVRGPGGSSPAPSPPAPTRSPSPTAAPIPTPTPAAAEGGACVHNTDCSANTWCSDLAYVAWCAAQGVDGDCPSPQCRRSESSESSTTTASTTSTIAPATSVQPPTSEPEPEPEPVPETVAPSEEPTPPEPISSSKACVTRRALECINEYSSYWPKCSPRQAKSGEGPKGYEFGHYCDEDWVVALNEVLAGSVVDRCSDTAAIQKFLAQVAYETGYFSTVYQPADGGAGLIHMIPGNWKVNAEDMDALWPGNDYVGKVDAMGKTFFQTAAYGWRSVAAWFKRTNRVIGGCGLDLFQEPFNTQTRCILSREVDRSEALAVVGRCLASFPAGEAGPSTSPEGPSTLPVTATTEAPATTTEEGRSTTPSTVAVGSGKCVRNEDCSANPWCRDGSYAAWCAAQGRLGACPSPQCSWDAAEGQASLLSGEVDSAGTARRARRRRQQFLGTALMQRGRSVRRLLALASSSEEL